MKKTILIISSMLFGLISIKAQSGQPAVKIFSNFNYDLSSEDSENAFKEFEIKRAYLGYSHDINENFSTKITYDIGSNSGGSSYTAFLKIAALKWKANDNMSINIGMIGTKNFKFMEKNWGRRYIEKSAQDKYKWASAADAGVSMDYKLTNNVSMDAQVLNGEGYKKTQSENGLFRGGLGITFKALDNLSLRVHQDISPRSTYDDMSESQTITTAAIAYASDNITVGAETGIMKNVNNVKDEEENLISVYGSIKLSESFTLFARHDDVSETSQNGTYTIYGLERKMAKGVTVALNMQSWTDSSDGAEAENTLYLNLEYKF
jgi:hypothetical protein